MRSNPPPPVRLCALVAAMAVLGPVVDAAAEKAAPPVFVDERRLPPSDAEARQRAEEERKRGAEAEARQKAEAEQRAKSEAEASQKAEEQRRRAAETEAREKAEAERRQAAEAEARAKAEAERRQAAEAEERAKSEAVAREKADAERRRAAESERRNAAEAEARQKAAKPAPPTVPQPVARAAADCGTDKIGARAVSGGRIVLDIETPCRPNARTILRYGPFEFVRQLDGAGRLTAELDLFQGKTTSVSLQIGDGPRQPVALDAVDLGGLSKVAVVWRAPVNLDLHVYEYAARPGAAGHVWAGGPRSAEESEAEARASARGRGFLSTADDGSASGDHAEVYTFWHHPGQQSGLIATALDYETRGAQPSGETCGSGAHASIVYDTFHLGPRGDVVRERGTIVPATCGAQLSGAGRYMEDAVPDIDARP